MIRKPKSKSLANVKKATWAIFSRYIRLRDCLQTTGSKECGECLTCGETRIFTKLQAGHFIPKHSGNYFSERGVHAQCRDCNIYGKKGQAAGMPHEYRRQLVKMYGEEVTNELEREPSKVKKYTVEELEELQQDLKEKIRILDEVH